MRHDIIVYYIHELLYLVAPITAAWKFKKKVVSVLDMYRYCFTSPNQYDYFQSIYIGFGPIGLSAWLTDYGKITWAMGKSQSILYTGP